MAAYVINFTDPALTYDKVDCLTVILYIKPVTYILAFAVYWKRLVIEAVSDHERNQFFREMIRAIVV
jgi:hypothetical protein